ncbi:hypothetical protein H7J88_18025 [Mycolicibacterium flavescens]|uniref:Transmembrane protein n=1 Tax=Mycolicibacterium flavescens TaxID=1776 RepID=A0A1E3RP04_MYCFV|nr:hypothetical protein [Mycolicibacterium flavescens]MCV7281534.1 hypothetical protein [Mycolicibacterium flavescens]ODQ91581.1 hypothetical protein BHQ18_05755 [Mycolicibacterium flavescens]
MTDDVEKRWDRPAAFRAAASYVGVVVAIAAVVFVVYALTAKTSVVAASAVPAALFLGGLGAFGKTYQVWKAKGTWVQWQGAGWFLLTLMLVCLSIPGAAAMAE